MTTFGKPLSDYFAFCKPFLVLLPLVGIIRLALSLSGTPDTTARWFSMTALVWIAIVYYSIRVHTSGFGSYKQLLVICVLLNLSTQVISIGSIVLAILTDTNNVFSAPEAFFGSDGKNWTHALLHVFVGIPVGSLVAWLIGSLILTVTRKVSAAPDQVRKAPVNSGRPIS
jgi:hypothetical protein